MYLFIGFIGALILLGVKGGASFGDPLVDGVLYWPKAVFLAALCIFFWPVFLVRVVISSVRAASY